MRFSVESLSEMSPDEYLGDGFAGAGVLAMIQALQHRKMMLAPATRADVARIEAKVDRLLAEIERRLK